MTDYTLISRFRNKTQCELLVNRLREKGKTCYNFCAKPVDPSQPDADPEVQMRTYESNPHLANDEYARSIFEQDLQGLREAKAVIVLLPAGNSTHIEAGIAYGLGKPLIMIGEPEKPESLYFIFSERYQTAEEFLASL